MSGNLKKRSNKKTGASEKPVDVSVEDQVDFSKKIDVKIDFLQTELAYYVACGLITVVAAYLRFSNISYPKMVVFDEVHFGKFASYYLERTYFFDLHPPFAKLLIAFVGWLVGYGGEFKFNNIGDKYEEQVPAVPYVAYRALSAIQGTAVVPLLFWTLKTLKFSVLGCFFAASIICFDNAHVIDSRLILLDSTLILAVALTIFSYVKFSTFRLAPFSKNWWIWLYATGISLSLVISTKYVGVFTYFTIGLGVLFELWILIDIKKGLLIPQIALHFFARAWALIFVPFCLYLFWFYLHFQILTKSGPGDAFMSSEFQETLEESPMARDAKELRYFDHVTFVHKDTEGYLHSHLHNYPLRYEDGRISSQGQQVNAVFQSDNKEAEDPNNWWEIVPTNNGATANTNIFTEDVVRLRHVNTGGFMLTHDVASPLKNTNEEFTVVHNEVADQRYNETLFKFKHYDVSSKTSSKREVIKSHSSEFKLLHVATVVAMWSHDDELLPEWAFNQREVSGIKKITEKDVAWRVQDIVNMKEDDSRAVYEEKPPRKIPFLKKWWELQILMFRHNNLLSLEHPYASQPAAWPLALSGVSFWNNNDEKKQIMFIGNVVGWWTEVAFIAIYIGLILADQVSRRRGIFVLTNKARSRLYYTIGFFLAGWAAHYLPFFLMNRQKFLHHYLPAHLIAAAFTGALADFVCSDNTTVSGVVNYKKMVVCVTTSILSIIWCFNYFHGITYGDISYTSEEVRARQWLDIVLHYSK